jgi:hypothetical protein
MANVDWNNLKHAQGSATQVPQLILDLARPGHPADAASFHLTEALVLGGTWLPTSVPAAELLLDLLTRADSEPVPRALRLLADLASAGHLWFFTPAAPARRKQDAVGQATLALAQRALPLARTWLTSPEAELRAAAIFFLSLVEEDAASAAAIAELARTETTPELRGGAALALGFFARAGNEASQQVLGELSGDRYLRAGVWAGRVIAGLPCSEQETTAGVGAWFSDWRPSLLPWGYTRPREVVMVAVRLVPNFEELAPPLVRAAKLGATWQESRALCSVAVDLAGFTKSFDESEVVPAAALSPLQRATAEALIAQPSSLRSLGHGLPGSSRAAARWLGLAAPGPLEQVEDSGLMRWQRVRSLYAATEPPTADAIIAASLGGLNPTAQLEVATELVLGAYRILIQIDAKISPSALAELAKAAGDDGVRWAKDLADRAAAAWAAEDTTYQLSPRYWMMILCLLIDAGLPIEAAWEPLITVDASPGARKVLTALTDTQRDRLVLDRAAQLEEEDDVKADFLNELSPQLDLLGSATVLKALREVLESGEVADLVDADLAEQLRGPLP